MVVSSLVADTEVQFLHTLDLITDVLELADAAVGWQTLHDMGEGIGDCIGLFGVFEHCLIIEARVGDEDNGDIQNIDILLVGFNVTITDSLEAYAFLESFLTDTNLLTVAFGGHSDHVALGLYMILAEFDILECAVDFFILTFECADSQEHDSGKRRILLDFLEVRTVEQYPVLVNKL